MSGAQYRISAKMPGPLCFQFRHHCGHARYSSSACSCACNGGGISKRRQESIQDLAPLLLSQSVAELRETRIQVSARLSVTELI